MIHPALAALGSHPYLSLETFKKDGGGVRTPVWFAVHGGAVFVFTDGTSFKVKRVRRNPAARLARCNVDGSRIESAWFDAQATIVPPSAEHDAGYAALRAKYGWQMKLLDLGSKLAGRYGRRALLKLEFTPAG